MYPISLEDCLEWIPAEETSIRVFSREDGQSLPKRLVDLEGKENLVLKAFEILSAEFPLPKLNFYLLKNIPMGAGLGGGSSDAAFTLVYLNQVFKLGLGPDQIRQYATKLGSDCAFFVEPRPSLSKGRGEILESFPLDLSTYWIIIIKPRFSISTAEAYSRVFPGPPEYPLEMALKSPISSWKEMIYNDFEKSLFDPYPELKSIKMDLYAKGAVYASLSGSGSALYGIFEKKPEMGLFEKCGQVFYLNPKEIH